ncbi:NAD+ kinase [bacterium]|nr:NAD+ kinase [bacterium]
MGLNLKSIALVTRETRLQGLKQRWGTARQADFLMEAAVDHEVERRRKLRTRRGIAVTDDDLDAMAADAQQLADAGAYRREDDQYSEALWRLNKQLSGLGYPVQRVDRSFLANFDFDRCLAVVVLGQDGLVANTAKYVGDLPVIGVNPDPAVYDGVLLPFQVNEARAAVQRLFKKRHRIQQVTLAEVNTISGQRMLAFNDFFIGCRSHVSARYTLNVDSASESQSSSGVLISTGSGSTGWISSVFNMASGVSQFVTGNRVSPLSLARDERRLIWAVREPFVSRHSGASQVIGVLGGEEEMVIGSQMPTDGVIFSDGIENDYIEFNSGNIGTFTVSQQRAHLVIG